MSLSNTNIFYCHFALMLSERFKSSYIININIPHSCFEKQSSNVDRLALFIVSFEESFFVKQKWWSKIHIGRWHFFG